LDEEIKESNKPIEFAVSAQNSLKDVIILPHPSTDYRLQTMSQKYTDGESLMNANRNSNNSNSKLTEMFRGHP